MWVSDHRRSGRQKTKESNITLYKGRQARSRHQQRGGKRKRGQRSKRDVKRGKRLKEEKNDGNQLPVARYKIKKVCARYGHGEDISQKLREYEDEKEKGKNNWYETDEKKSNKKSAILKNIEDGGRRAHQPRQKP